MVNSGEKELYLQTTGPYNDSDSSAKEKKTGLSFFKIDSIKKIELSPNLVEEEVVESE